MDRTSGTGNIPNWEKSEDLLRDLGADELVIETVRCGLDDGEVQGRISKMRTFAQENPLVVLGALSALLAGGAVAAGQAVRKSNARRRRARTSSSSKKSKRTLIEPHPGDKRFIRRDAKGRIKESVDVGRSLSADRQRQSKTRAKSGQGDTGDRKRTSGRRRTSQRTSAR